jgi:restriction system protein
MLSNGYTGIDFTELPDLQGVEDLAAMRTLVAQSTPGLKAGAVGNYAAQLFAFAKRMSIGDTVILPVRATSKLAFGVVTGEYQYLPGADVLNHVRKVDWKRTDVPRNAINQDLLYSLGAFSTVVQISRNDAAYRFLQILNGADQDPGARSEVQLPVTTTTTPDVLDAEEAIANDGFDVLRYSKDRVLGRIKEQFAGHRLADLIAAILRAEGMTCRVSPPGADGGIDIIAGSGVLGISGPTVIVQVKSQQSRVGSEVLDQLGGVVSQHSADHGLLVAMGGLTTHAQARVDAQRLKVAVWDEEEVIRRLYEHYDAMPEDIRADIPLRRAWVIDEASPADQGGTGS